MSYAGLLNASARIVHQTSKATSTTGYPIHSSSQFTQQPCAIQPGASSTLVSNEKRSSAMVWTGFFPVAARIRTGDVVSVLGGPANLVGREFRVIGLAMDAAGRGHHIEVPLEEVGP